MGANIAISNGSHVDWEWLELSGGGEGGATAGSGKPIGVHWKPVWSNAAAVGGGWVGEEQLAVKGDPEVLELSDDDEGQGEDDHSTTPGFENPNTGYETGDGVDRPSKLLFGEKSEHTTRMFGQGGGELYIPGHGR